ncbi:MAG: SpoIIE family protein phosphatase [Chloroflexaceae bacterium]|nr:SpoIIE family protein phosphatase [Chloroflexaceae bacterium]
MRMTWGAVNRPKQGQSISGDTFVAQEWDNGQALFAVIDGLGGGEEASFAARSAASVLEEHPDYPLEQLIRQSHHALRSTRGAVIALLRMDGTNKKASFIGVGNIGIQVYSNQPIKPISKNGILGYRMPTLLELHYSYNSGDTFVLYSDGISGRFNLDGKIDIALPPQSLAAAILDRYGKTNDDATVVVIRD